LNYLAKDIVTLKLCESENGLKTIVDLPGDLLIIPQATLGGRVHSHRFQYHHNINKDTGQEFYDKFVLNLREACSQNKENVVHAGSYGIRQIYSCETNGPAMHIIEF
jgi:D-tyrosyl-tRNA(Tyr) deacylase